MNVKPLAEIGLLLYLLLLFPISLFGQKSLPYRADGSFVILHFSDCHFDGNHPGGTDSTFRTIRALIASAKPDLAVFNGDIVTERAGAESCWKEIVRVMEEEKLPFVVTMGNHDAEILPKAKIFSILERSKYYYGSRGPEELSPSMGNCYVTLTSREGADANCLYFLDSNDYHPNKFVQHYDWIHFDQIAWYRRISQSLKERNGNKPLPSLIFFHIPLPEFEWLVGDDRTFGTREEGDGAPRTINSGLFASFIDMGDVMGVISGHNHDNDLIGINRDIALAYGRVTGHDAYGTPERGGRVIKLYEGQRRFDTRIETPTWKEPTYYYPSGITSAEEETSTYLPALKTKAGESGVAYRYYEGKYHQVSDLREKDLKKTGVLPYFSIKEGDKEDHFGYKFETLIKIPERGIYRFYTYSDDGSILKVDGVVVVDNDGGHSARRAEGKVALEEGFHHIEVLYFEDYMGEELEVGFSSKTLTDRPLPKEILFLPPASK